MRALQRAGEIKSITRRGIHTETRTERLSPCAHVELAAYLTAAARVELHRQLLAAGDDAIYCDTDSVYSRVPLTRRIGDDLGEWGCEGSMSEWRAVAPKLYRYRDQHGKWIVKGKGLPGLTPDGFAGLIEGKAWTVDRGVSRYRTARRTRRDGTESLFERRSLTRTIGASPGWCGARCWDGTSETTQAPRAGDTPPKATKPIKATSATKGARSRGY